MVLITHPLDGRKRPQGGLVHRLAALSLALIWMVALSVAASSLWADDPSSRVGGRENQVLSLELKGTALDSAEAYSGRDGA